MNAQEIMDRVLASKDISSSTLDMCLFSEYMAEAISQDVCPVDAGDLFAKCFEPRILEDGAEYGMLGSDSRHISPGLASILYEAWMAEIGEFLGFPPGVDDDDSLWHTGWIDSGEPKPNIREVSRVLIKIHLQVIRAAIRSFEQQNNHTLLDVFMKSSVSNEEFDQAHARLYQQSKGLHLVR